MTRLVIALSGNRDGFKRENKQDGGIAKANVNQETKMVGDFPRTPV